MSKEKTNSLLNCPFCGGELAIRKWVGFDGESFSLKCNTDGCVLSVDSFRDKEELIRKANTRKPMQNIVERLEEELHLSDKEKRRCIHDNPLQFDEAKGYTRGIANVIEVIKEEGEIDDNH